jgi:hypothetical protein
VFFPSRSSNLFATYSAGRPHVWDSEGYQGILRVDIPRPECNCVAISADGLVSKEVALQTVTEIASNGNGTITV